MILDLEGATGQRASSPRLGTMLSFASMAVAAAALLVIAALPHEPAPRVVPVVHTSVLEQAFKAAQPRLSLILPADIAVPLAPTGGQFGSGIGRSVNSTRTYRLRASRDSVTIAAVPDALPVVAPAPRPPDALSVHGNYAQSWTVEPTSISVVRWTENGTTYEIASRTLLPADLVRVAELLH